MGQISGKSTRVSVVVLRFFQLSTQRTGACAGNRGERDEGYVTCVGLLGWFLLVYWCLLSLLSEERKGDEGYAHMELVLLVVLVCWSVVEGRRRIHTQWGMVCWLVWLVWLALVFTSNMFRHIACFIYCVALCSLDS